MSKQDEHIEQPRKFPVEWLEPSATLKAAEHTKRLEARVRELEQERDRLPANWWEDSSLATWFPLTAEELERTKAQLAAVTQERDQTAKEFQAAWNTATEMNTQLAQLQATNKALREALQQHGEHGLTCDYEYGTCGCGLDAALTRTEEEPKP